MTYLDIISLVITFVSLAFAIYAYRETNKESRMKFECHTETKLQTHEEKINKIEDRLDDLHKGLTEVVIKLDVLLNTKPRKAMTQKKSPRALNNLGKEVFNQIIGKEFFDANKDRFIHLLENRNPQTALDVENWALDVLYSQINDPIFNPIKNKVYDSPSFKLENGEPYDLDMAGVCLVLSIPLRDAYLEKHPELNSD